AAWAHDINHRLGVPYDSAAVAARYGQNAAGYAAREEFRGRAASGQFGEPPRGLQGVPGGGSGAARRPQPRGGAEIAGAGGLERFGAAGAAGEFERRGAAGAGEFEPRGMSGAAGYNPRALEGVGQGDNVRRESARGAESRNAMASPYGAERRPPEGEAF